MGGEIVDGEIVDRPSKKGNSDGVSQCMLLRKIHK